MEYTIEEVREMLLQAFDRGENWGVTYSGWSLPSKEDRISTRKLKLMRLPKIARIVSILRDIVIIIAIIFACIAAYKFMVYFSVWDLPPLE